MGVVIPPLILKRSARGGAAARAGAKRRAQKNGGQRRAAIIAPPPPLGIGRKRPLGLTLRRLNCAWVRVISPRQAGPFNRYVHGGLANIMLKGFGLCFCNGRREVKALHQGDTQFGHRPHLRLVFYPFNDKIKAHIPA